MCPTLKRTNNEGVGYAKLKLGEKLHEGTLFGTLF